MKIPAIIDQEIEFTVYSHAMITPPKEDLGTVANKCWVINGHLAEIQQLCVGKDFLFKGVKNNQGVNGLISAKDHKPLTDILYRSVWKCVDVQIKPRHADDGLLMDDRSPVVLVMENQQYGKVSLKYKQMHQNFAPPQFGIPTSRCKTMQNIISLVYLLI